MLPEDNKTHVCWLAGFPQMDQNENSWPIHWVAFVGRYLVDNPPAGHLTSYLSPAGEATFSLYKVVIDNTWPPLGERNQIGEGVLLWKGRIRLLLYHIV